MSISVPPTQSFIMQTKAETRRERIMSYCPFVTGVPFSGEGATVFCHQFIDSREWRDGDSVNIGENHARSDYQAQLISSRHAMFPWIATGTPIMNGQ
jgi:hypothetical protein